MDFFAAQDSARRNSRWLVFWFLLAVAGIIATVYGVAVFLFAFSDPVPLGSHAVTPVQWWDPGLFSATSVAVGSLIGMGSLYKVSALARGGGASVAEELGGRLVPRASTDPLERRLINVVDEMAISAGIPSPPVYVLDAEQGINAFAAGARTNDGVVAVTRGMLEQLSRDELQAVIGHEFSHIVNGDMRLNLRLIGVLHGILLLTLAGRVLLRGSRGSDKGALPMLAIGLVLVIVGYVGVFFGKLIKAAVSREREYLADAAAVQFTRNPAGLASALKRIAAIGSNLQHPRAEEASHMFFSSGFRFSSLFATHPPIEKRIRRLDPSFSGLASSPPQPLSSGQGLSEADFSVNGFVAAVGASGPPQLAEAQALIARIADSVARAAHQPGTAPAVLFALFLREQSEQVGVQLDLIEAGFGPTARADALTHAQWLHKAGPAFRLPMLDMSVAALSELSSEASGRVLQLIDRLIDSDGKVSLFEYALRRLIRDALAPRSLHHGSAVTLATLKKDFATLIALLAQVGHDDPTLARESFDQATQRAPLDGPFVLPPLDRLGIAELDRILGHLGACKAAFRRGVLEACATAVLHDGKVEPIEAELLRAVARALDCPLPPLLRYASR